MYRTGVGDSHGTSYELRALLRVIATILRLFDVARTNELAGLTGKIHELL